MNYEHIHKKAAERYPIVQRYETTVERVAFNSGACWAQMQAVEIAKDWIADNLHIPADELEAKMTEFENHVYNSAPKNDEEISPR